METKQEKTHTQRIKQLRSPVALCSSFASLWIPDSFCSLRRVTRLDPAVTHQGCLSSSPKQMISGKRQNQEEDKKRKKRPDLTVKLFKPFKVSGGTGSSAVCSYQKCTLAKLPSWERDGGSWKCCQFSFDACLGCTRLGCARPFVHQTERHLFTRKDIEKSWQRYSAWTASSIVINGKLRLNSPQCRGEIMFCSVYVLVVMIFYFTFIADICTQISFSFYIPW